MPGLACMWECLSIPLSNRGPISAKFDQIRQFLSLTNFFHMRGGRFHAENTLCTFKLYRGLRGHPGLGLLGLSVGYYSLTARVISRWR